MQLNKGECCLQCGERSSPLQYLVGGRSRCPLCRLLGGLIRHGFAMGGEMFGDAPHAGCLSPGIVRIGNHAIARMIPTIRAHGNIPSGLVESLWAT